MREIEYRPQNIRETLVELKDSSELAVDLAYASVLFDNQELAREVVELATRASYLRYHARIAMMLAAKTSTDAERLVGLFQVVDGAVDVTEAAADIARITLRDVGMPAAFGALPEAQERFVRAEIADSSPYAGRGLHELELDVDEGVKVLAIRRDTEWTLGPDGDDQLLAGDVVVARGPEAGVGEFFEDATGEQYRPAPVADDGEIRRAVETVVELKNVSELAIGLAYSAALYDSDAIAGEVHVLERRADELREELERWVVSAASGSNGEDVDGLRGLFHVAVAAEVMSDAALDVAEVVFREVELHPVFAQAIRESDEIITSVEVGPGALVGETVGAIEHDVETGMTVLALHRADGWTYAPDDETTIREGDRLVLKGPERGERRLQRLAG